MGSKNICYNIAQFAVVNHHKLINMFEGGRGIGKSTIMGRIMSEQVHDLPRGTGILVGATYVQMLTRTLPSTIRGLEMHGIIKDVHFFVGRKAPKSYGWPEPWEPPLDYKHCIHFYTGFVYRMVSQDRPGDGRGINSDCVLGDEAAMLDLQELEDSVLTTCRGTNPSELKYYKTDDRKRIPRKYFLSQFYFTSTPRTKKGEWIFKYEELALNEPHKYFYLRAPSYVNIGNLGSGYFENLKKTMHPVRYSIEIECKRGRGEHTSFYPLLSDHHEYTLYDYSKVDGLDLEEPSDCSMDGDLDKYSELYGGLDFGAAINSLVLGQMDESCNTLRLIKNLFALNYNQEILKDLARKFCHYYRHHHKKVLYLYYDNTGNNEQANSRYTLAEEFKRELGRAGWRVVLCTGGGSNPRHWLKYKIWNECLREDEQYRKYPMIRINRDNCAELLVSMSNTPAKRDNAGVVKKDKSSERRLKGENRILATDLSDAADALVYGLLSNQGSGLGVTDTIPTHL